MEMLKRLESKLLYWVQAHRTPVLDGIMTFITSLGNGGFIWVLLTVGLLARKKTRKAGVMMAAALALNAVLVNLLLKNIFARVRPFEALSGFSVIVRRPADWSFPSGHSSSSIAAAFVALRRLPRKVGVPAMVLAGLICISRVYVGAHYPTDVIGGVVVGLLCGWLAEKIALKLPGKVKRMLRMEE